MQPVSARFVAALREAHVIATRCELFFPEHPEPILVPVQGGDITIDRTAQVRRSGNVQIPWSLKVGADLGLDLRTLPLGGYARLYRGLRYPGRGSEELVLLGHFRVESVTWRTQDDAASLELGDRMAQVRDEPFLGPYVPVPTIGGSQQGTLHDDSPLVTGLTDTSSLLVGMSVSGIGIPAGRRIQSIDSPTQVTLNGKVNIIAWKDGKLRPPSAVIDGITDTTDLTPQMVVTLRDGSADLHPGTVVSAIDTTHSIVVNPAPRGTGDHPMSLDAPATQTLAFGGGIRVADAAIEIVQEVFGATIGYLKLADPAAVLVDVTFSQNRAEALQVLALAAGCEQYFSPEGDYVFAPPAGQTEPVWMVDAAAHGVMVGADESLSRTGVFNGVLFQGQNAASDAPVAALVVDDDPASPTRWGGPLGKVARIEQSSAVQTPEQAAIAAETLLARRLTLQRSLTVSAAPNPALEAGDVISVLFPDGRLERHLIDTVRLGLAPQAPQVLALHAIIPNANLQVTGRRFYGDVAWRELRDAVSA